MAASKHESPNADQLWAGEIKLTVHVPKELTPREERQLTKSFDELAKQFKAIAEATLPQGCRIDVEAG